MPFSAQIYPLLVSSPGDAGEDAGLVIDATLRWNVIYGKQFNASVMPLHWTSHAAAEYGIRPQESINEQLVEDAEIVIALFWHRLGSDTGKAESGTVEEIEEAHKRGAHVAVLRCMRDIPSSDLDAEQAKNLDTYLLGIRDKALVLEYNDDNGLRQHVEAILTHAVSASSAQAEAEVTTSPPLESDEPPAQVWPGLERREAVKTDSKGQVKTQNRWFLKLSNTGKEPAMHVKYVLEPDGEGVVPEDFEGDRELEVLPPGGESETQLHLHSGVASQARCTVTWEDSGGKHENVGSLRFF
ncbi:MAG: hypothetical protein JJE13_01195 [Thermoleophilia bacterium]|nr:hypothetical protein [Thermoleophilia bacterium]